LCFADDAQKGLCAVLTNVRCFQAWWRAWSRPDIQEQSSLRTSLPLLYTLDAALSSTAKKLPEVEPFRRSPSWFKTDREVLIKGIASRSKRSGQLFKRPKDTAIKAEFARARHVLRKAVWRARASWDSFGWAREHA
jgi:hypothetical protein